MADKSRRYFFIFFRMLLASYSAILFFGTANLVLDNPDGFFFWYPLFLFPVSWLFITLYKSQKLPVVIRFILCFLLIAGSVFGVQYGYYFAKAFKIALYSPLTLASISGVLFVLMWFFAAPVQKGFHKIDKVIDNESMFEDRSKYLQWVGEEYGERMDRMEPKWFVNLAVNTGIFFMVFLFVSLARNPEGKWLLSLFAVCFAFSALGIYLVLYQYSSILKWKFLGFHVKPEIIENWNNLFKFFFIPIIIIPLILPWNFIIIRLQFLTDFLKRFFHVNVGTSGPIENANNLTGSDNPTQAGNSETGFFSNIRIIIQIAFVLFIAFIVIYIILALLGFLFLKIFQGKKKPPLVVFCIRCSERVSSIFSFVIEVLWIIFKTFLRVFGIDLDKKEEEEKKEKLAQHFASFFNDYRKMTSEKLEEIKTIIREFIRLVETASRLVTPFVLHFGPTEYMSLVSEKLPEARQELSEIVSIFNESRYSLHLLDNARKERFRQLINETISKMHG